MRRSTDVRVPEPRSPRATDSRFQFAELDTSDPRWRELLHGTEHDIYHMPQYLALEAARTGASGGAALVSWESGALLVPYMARKVPSEPSVWDASSPYGYGGALLLGESDLATRRAAVREFQNGMRELRFCSVFLRLHPMLDAINDAFDVGTLHSTGETVVIDLTRTQEDILEGMTKDVRRVVRRSRESGMVTDFPEATDVQVRNVAEIYTETMKRVGAEPVYYTFDLGYFKALLGDLEGHVGLSTVRLDGETLCASVVSRSSGIVNSLLGGTRTSFLRMRPSVLETYDTVRWYQEAGARVLNLGGGVGGQRDSLFRFKRSFSPDTRAFRTARIVLDPATYQRLVEQRAGELGVSTAQLAATGFFPTYRAAA